MCLHCRTTQSSEAAELPLQKAVALLSTVPRQRCSPRKSISPSAPQWAWVRGTNPHNKGSTWNLPEIRLLLLRVVMPCRVSSGQLGLARSSRRRAKHWAPICMRKGDPQLAPTGSAGRSALSRGSITSGAPANSPSKSTVGSLAGLQNR